MKTKISKFGIFYILISAITGAMIPFLIRIIIDDGMRVFALMDNKLFLVILFVLQAIFLTLGNIQYVNIAEEYSFELRNKIINRILKSEYKLIDRLGLGKIPSHLDNNIRVIQEYQSQSVPNLISAIFIVIISLGLLFKLDWKMTLLLIVLLPIIALVIIPVTMLAGRYAEGFQKENLIYLEKISNIFSNTLYLKSLNAEESVEVDLIANNKIIRNFSAKNNKINAFIYPFLLFVVIGILALIFIYGGNRVSEGRITVGTLIAFLLYVFQLLSPVSGISKFFADKERARINYEELANYLELSQEEDRGKILDKIESIQYKDVRFSYKEESILNGISFSISKGEKVAIVGESSSGKSTVFKMLLQLYDPDEGTIVINGENLGKYSKTSVRNAINVIPQENSIVYSNLYNFLLLGMDDFNESRAVEILKSLGLYERFDPENNSLKDVEFGIGGKNLSTGEKQRLLIAKALLSESEVLLMDESTSSVDSELENQIFKIVEKYYQEKIVMSIAHRLSTVKYVDRVIFFENGSITGNAPHEKLYSSHEKYKTYIDLQNIEIN